MKKPIFTISRLFPFLFNTSNKLFNLQFCQFKVQRLIQREEFAVLLNFL